MPFQRSSAQVASKVNFPLLFTALNLSYLGSMPLNQSDIDELKQIYCEEFGKPISDEEAWEMGARLLRLFYILCIPPDHSEMPEQRPKHLSTKS